MMKRTSSGVAEYRRLVIMPLTATDLPDPVVPATKRCGILDRFTLTGAPLVSLPRQI